MRISFGNPRKLLALLPVFVVQWGGSRTSNCTKCLQFHIPLGFSPGRVVLQLGKLYKMHLLVYTSFLHSICELQRSWLMDCILLVVAAAFSVVVSTGLSLIEFWNISVLVETKLTFLIAEGIKCFQKNSKTIRAWTTDRTLAFWLPKSSGVVSKLFFFFEQQLSKQSYRVVQTPGDWH